MKIWKKDMMLSFEELGTISNERSKGPAYFLPNQSKEWIDNIIAYFKKHNKEANPNVLVVGGFYSCIAKAEIPEANVYLIDYNKYNILSQLFAAYLIKKDKSSAKRMLLLDNLKIKVINVEGEKYTAKYELDKEDVKGSRERFKEFCSLIGCHDADTLHRKIFGLEGNLRNIISANVGIIEDVERTEFPDRIIYDNMLNITDYGAKFDLIVTNNVIDHFRSDAEIKRFITSVRDALNRRGMVEITKFSSHKIKISGLKKKKRIEGKAILNNLTFAEEIPIKNSFICIKK